MKCENISPQGKLSQHAMLQQANGPRMTASMLLRQDPDGTSQSATTRSSEAIAPIVMEESALPQPVVSLPPPPPDAPVASSPFTATAPASAAKALSPEAARLTYWARLREVARWQRSINLAFAGAAGLFAVAKGIGTVSHSPAVDSVTGPLAGIAVTAFWVWLIVKLTQALDMNVWLYGVLGIVPGLNFLLLLQLQGHSDVEIGRDWRGIPGYATAGTAADVVSNFQYRP